MISTSNSSLLESVDLRANNNTITFREDLQPNNHYKKSLLQENETIDTSLSKPENHNAENTRSTENYSTLSDSSFLRAEKITTIFRKNSQANHHYKKSHSQQDTLIDNKPTEIENQNAEKTKNKEKRVTFNDNPEVSEIPEADSPKITYVLVTPKSIPEPERFAEKIHNIDFCLFTSAQDMILNLQCQGHLLRENVLILDFFQNRKPFFERNIGHCKLIELEKLPNLSKIPSAYLPLRFRISLEEDPNSFKKYISHFHNVFQSIIDQKKETRSLGPLIYICIPSNPRYMRLFMIALKLTQDQFKDKNDLAKVIEEKAKEYNIAITESEKNTLLNYALMEK